MVPLVTSVSYVIYKLQILPNKTPKEVDATGHALLFKVSCDAWNVVCIRIYIHILNPIIHVHVITLTNK